MSAAFPPLRQELQGIEPYGAPQLSLEQAPVQLNVNENPYGPSPEAAADIAHQLTRLVERTSVQHGGRPVKWLGDGVMFYFPNPGPGVVAALDMADGVADAGLPPAFPRSARCPGVVN